MLIGTKELKERGYTDWMIRTLVNAKDTPFFRIGKKWRVHEEELDRYEKGNRVNSNVLSDECIQHNT